MARPQSSRRAPRRTVTPAAVAIPAPEPKNTVVTAAPVRPSASARRSKDAEPRAPSDVLPPSARRSKDAQVKTPSEFAPGSARRSIDARIEAPSNAAPAAPHQSKDARVTAPPEVAAAPARQSKTALRARLGTKKRFVALAGNIGAGKTTAAKLLSQTLGFELFDEPVIDNRFLREYYANMQRWSFTLQLEFLIRRVEHHELIHKVAKSCVQDRTLYEDPEIFAKYLHGLGNLTDAELDLYFEYFQRLSRNIARPDKVICFDVSDVSVLLERIRTRGREEESGIQTQFLRGLNGYYASFHEVLRKKYEVDCLVIDVSATDIRNGRGREEFLDRVTTFIAS